MGESFDFPKLLKKGIFLLTQSHLFMYIAATVYTAAYNVYVNLGSVQMIVVNKI